MQDIVVFGTGGFGREVHQIIEDLQARGDALNFLGFLDGNANLHNTQVHGFPVLGGVEWLNGRTDVLVGMGVGNPKAKRKMMGQIAELGARCATLVHPLAWVGNRVDLGEGSIVCAGAMITTDIRLDRGVIININCTVGHDTTLHDYVTVAPGATISGNVVVGEGTDLGTNSAIIQGVTVGEWVILGAGAVVSKDLPANVTAVGIPAKVIKERPIGWHQE
ncbi:acetyltransferase [Deinococcus marmoris]|uniref:Acetyltransferase (Isoleucine patch superfamily) n=1 Tax=Deinococcus marmoris TaxID=249408 RepID=A0A1U7NSF7_9DEIO|nr:acetyltransferase [Deinococcus marmoris]OLV15841.1 Acetyltransferase (isoleucine patch superfamily) [Deinococcus marmoris]